jgi:arsenite methyltransferase
VPAIEIGKGFGGQLYAPAERGQLPTETVAASLGCGNPLAVDDLHDGKRVLDLGSGSGIDVALGPASRTPTGRAHGLDMTNEMLTLARTNATQACA